jgi:hypothetical protein
MTAATTTSLGVTLTGLSRRAAGDASGRPYRDADTGAWCDPFPPHVPGCTCQLGGSRCDACWRAWGHHVATNALENP